MGASSPMRTWERKGRKPVRLLGRRAASPEPGAVKDTSPAPVASALATAPEPDGWSGGPPRIPQADVVARCQDVARYFGPVRAVDGASLALKRGQLVTLIGPSGCGKTTLLRLLAGFEVPDRGRVELDGVVVAEPGRSVPPERRQVGMVFQDYALFPHLTVAENIAFGLRAGADPRKEVARWIRRVGLEGLEHRYPHQLSGGQQQRVALARALAARPRLLLLDEPFASVDLGTRVRLRRELKEIIQQEGLTALLVTHDREEALSVADLVAVMAGGRILQVGTPEVVYEQPLSPGLAALLGEVNLLPGQSRGSHAITPVGPLPLRRAHPLGPVLVMMRPEWLTCARDPGGPLQVVQREFYGAYQMVSLRLLADPAPQVDQPGAAEPCPAPAAEPAGLALPALIGRSATPLRVRCPAAPAFRRGDRVRVQALQPAIAWAQGPVPGEGGAFA